MGTTLQHGIFLPAEGERNCYAGLASNWTILDGVVGGYSSHAANLTIHVTAADKEAWNGKADASALTAHTGDTTIHVTAEDKQAWNEHVADTVKHVTASDKQTWNGKQDALSQTQLDAVNSGIDSSKVQQIATNTSDISSLQSGKANDSDVVHKRGNETIAGVKTFTDNPLVGNSNNNITISNRQITANGSASTTGNHAYSYMQLLAKVTYADSSSPINVTVALEINEDAYADGKKSSFRPSGNNVTNLGMSGKRWANVYATNYYYGGSEIEFSQKFVTTDTNQTISGNKTFSSINGVEPSSLSLPSSSVTIDISSYITDLTGVNVNNYTPLANGYIVITCNSNDVDYIKMSNNLDFVSVVDNTNNQFTSGILGVWQPCIAGVGIQIRIKSSALRTARFIPCQGNV